MKAKTKKRLKIAFALVLVLLLAVDIFGANFLVSFAIGRTTSGGASVAPPPSTTSQTQSIVANNSKEIYQKTADWLETIKTEVVEISSADGLKLVGERYPANEKSSKWVIAVHGYTANRKMMVTYARFFAELGFNVLTPDLKAHGESEGSYIGMGWPDRKDILLWIDTILKDDPAAEIVLFGVSMGAGTVLMTSGETLPANVKAIVEDCGYTSVWDIFSDELKVLFHLPTFPLLPTASVISQFRAGYNFREASSVEQVKKTKLPILFIHGAEDNFVHTEMVYKLYEACPTEKDILVVDNAGHGQSYYYAPEQYEAKITDFLSKVIK